MNILYQEAVSMEIKPTIVTIIIIVTLLILILFCTVLADDYPILSTILIVGSIIGIIVGGRFSCITTPPETHYWVDCDTVSEKDFDKYELVKQKGKIYILREIEQAE